MSGPSNTVVRTRGAARLTNSSTYGELVTAQVEQHSLHEDNNQADSKRDQARKCDKSQESHVGIDRIQDEDEEEEEVEKEEESYIYHHEIFDQLVAIDSENGALQYVNEGPTKGIDPHDVTAYMDSQQSWAKELAHRPAVLTLWRAPPSMKITRAKVGTMRFNDHIVMDYEGNPIRDFAIPRAISSAVEGWRMEAWMRANPGMKKSDIVARMFTRHVGKKREPVHSARNLTTRTRRFRAEAGLVSWGPELATKAAVDYFESLRSEAQGLYNLAVQRDLTRPERSNYAWLTMGKGKWNRRYMHPNQRHARKDYPVGEFRPGARDPGDLFHGNFGNELQGMSTDSLGDSVNRAGGFASSPYTPSAATADGSSENEEAPNPDDYLDPNVWRDDHDPIRPSIATANGSTEDEELPNSDDYLNPEAWQDVHSANPTALSHMNTQAVEESDEVESVSGFANESEHDTESAGSFSSEPEDPTDSRAKRPTTIEEEEMLQSALEQTIASFQQITYDRRPDKTDPKDNYLDQWAALQMQLILVWRERWGHDYAPTLRGLDRWIGGIANWQTAALARPELDTEDEIWVVDCGQ